MYFEQNKYRQPAEEIRRARAQKAVGKLVHVNPLRAGQQGERLAFGVYAAPEARVRSVRLYVRSDRRQGPYTGFTLKLDDRGQGRVHLPAELVRAPGFAYFVEAELPGDRAQAVLGEAAAPHWCSVAPPAGQVVRSGMSRVKLTTEYVSFNRKQRNDWYVLTEGDYLLRMPEDVRMLRGVAVGYGHYRGEGGPVDEIDSGLSQPQQAAFTYGYLELHLSAHELFAIMPRVQVGLGRPEDGRQNSRGELTAGVQLRVRIGRDMGTHLVLAGQAVPEVGNRAFVRLNLGLSERFPLAFEVHVTDQPVGEGLGVRVVAEAGARITDAFALAARISYQGRTIEHTGFGSGLSLTFDW